MSGVAGYFIAKHIGILLDKRSRPTRGERFVSFGALSMPSFTSSFVLAREEVKFPLLIQSHDWFEIRPKRTR